MHEHQIEQATQLINKIRHKGNTLEEWLRRPEIEWQHLLEFSPELGELEISPRASEQVQIEVKYSGYIKRQQLDIERQNKSQSMKIPSTFDYHAVPQLRNEAKEKFTRVKPADVAQAGRISGITPADLAILTLYLHEPNRMVHKSTGA